MEQGFAVHELDVAWGERTRWHPAHLAVFWGHKAPLLIQGQSGIGCDYLVMELAYFGDRNRQFMSLGFNGLNGRAEFHNRNMPGDRWAKHGIEVKPWKRGGDYVLVMGQVEGDASLDQCFDYPLWLKQACEAAEAYGLPVKFRPHPKSRINHALAPICGGSLDEALCGAAAVIAWNSNSLVDAVLAGVPAVACDRGSMAWPMAAHDIGAELIRPDRTQWLHDLAYTQWTLPEVASGEAWAHLKQHFDGRELPELPPLPVGRRPPSRADQVDVQRAHRRQRWEARQMQLAELGLLKAKEA